MRRLQPISHGAPPTTVRHRRRGRARSQIELRSKRLSNQEERVLVEWIKDLQRQAAPPQHDLIRGVVVRILQKKGDSKPLGGKWTTKFLKRHRLTTGQSKKHELQRLTSLTYAEIEYWYAGLDALQHKYNVPPERTYNMDEKGFQMGTSHSSKVVFDKLEGPPISATTGITKWVSIIETVSMSAVALPPFVIFVGKVAYDTYFNEKDYCNDWHWGLSPKGWTDNQLGFDWLKYHFLKHSGSLNEHKILILDGHDSHVSAAFQHLSLESNLHLYLLPAHASGLLQPLDCGPFSTLASAYSKELEKHCASGYSTIDRRTFATIYAKARPQAFTERNVRAGWSATGIYPREIDKVLHKKSVVNFNQTTPQLRPSPVQIGSHATPQDIKQIQALTDRLCSSIFPSVEEGIRKHAAAAVSATTQSECASEELKRGREQSKATIAKKKKKQLNLQANKRTFTNAELKEAREALEAGKAPPKRKKRGLISVLHFTSPEAGNEDGFNS